MNRFLTFTLIIAFTVTGTFAGESLFGISNRSIGMLAVPYSAPGMGRSYEIAASDSMQINYINYSMWPDVSLTSYSVKLGYSAANGEDKNGETFFNDVANYAGGYLTIPVMKKRLSFGFGLLPYTDMEQRLKEDLEDGASNEILVRGGLSKSVINLSYRIMPNFGVGLAYEYSFGKITKDYRYDEEDATIDPLLLDYEYRMYGHGAVFSAHYQPLDKLNLGLVYRPQVDLDFRIEPNTNSKEVDVATLQTLTLPAQFSFGAEYKLKERTNIGFDFMYQDWQKEYALEEKKIGSPFTQYYSVSGGIERTPSKKLFTSFTEKVDYRAGLFYRQLSQTSAENPVKEFGFSFGFSVPLQRFRSKIDLSGLVGKRGDVSDNAYQETFYRIGLSVSAMETWFVKLED